MMPSPNQHRIKETINTDVEVTDDGQVRINQYLVKRYLGCGAYGTVSLAVNTEDEQEYAIKEFSKLKLRKLEQSRSVSVGPGRGRGWGARRAMRGRGMPMGCGPPATVGPAATPATSNPPHPLDPIKREVAIFKKLQHPNIVKLFEVLNDPDNDCLYMVYEMCHRGPIMDIALDKACEPYPVDVCRNYFQQALLGMEYLHENGIIHRDIKPDNLLLDCHGTLKIVDFGVSEMFTPKNTSPSTIATANLADGVKANAGSPAFMAPELCRAHHGEVSGVKADIWALGVTLYCLALGQLPFTGRSVPDMYEAIVAAPLTVPDTLDADLRDLLGRILDKNPESRLTLMDIRHHPWTTNHGQRPLASFDDNCKDVITEITEHDIQNAIKTIGNLATVLKAVHLFKARHRWSKQPQASDLSADAEETPE
ncbi:hypothetical protein H4R34_000059 [Dimargaris verticillata]|uniref:Protein kinase domain-containing protein n=1 Tax=Dimargaris verticillata TaxID=2761393 RepID=A0A9W8BCN1_9FUNG|nr:hypothetical protein H4R34_000059 [Dimargaris verticillata]